MTSLAFHLAVLVTFAFVAMATAASDSETFDRLLHNYNSADPPLSDEPTEVKLGLYINSLYAVNQLTMEYTISGYLRQGWRDPRLELADSSAQPITVGSGKWDELWLPDTFMRNEKHASFHQVTVPNRLLRINSTGHVWYVSKITMTLSCPMNLRNFPFDTHKCPLTFESYGYTMETLYFEWLKAPVDIDSDVQLPEFTLQDVVLKDCSQNYTSGAYPCLEAMFVLQRDIGYYLLQVYLPSMGLVVISWFTFWFPTKASEPRIILLFMSVICMSSLAHTMQKVLPKVSYIKAIDVWIMGCGTFLFAVIMELALVNIMNKPQQEAHKEIEPDEKSESLLGKIKMRFSHGSKVSKIDKISRVMFPIAYILFVIIYFIAYSG